MKQKKGAADDEGMNPRRPKGKAFKASQLLTILSVGTRVRAAAQAEGAGAVILASGTAAGLVGSKHGGHCRWSAWC